MSAEAPQTLAFTIAGPVAREDLAGLTERVCGLLRAAGGRVLVCDVSTVSVDAVAVDALARLALGARRSGAEVLLRGASPQMRELVAFMGLGDVLRPGDGPGDASGPPAGG